MRSISVATTVLETYLGSTEFAGCRMPELKRRLFFFWSLLGSLGLCIA